MMALSEVIDPAKLSGSAGGVRRHGASWPTPTAATRRPTRSSATTRPTSSRTGSPSRRRWPARMIGREAGRHRHPPQRQGLARVPDRRGPVRTRRTDDRPGRIRMLLQQQSRRLAWTSAVIHGLRARVRADAAAAAGRPAARLPGVAAGRCWRWPTPCTWSTAWRPSPPASWPTASARAACWSSPPAAAALSLLLVAAAPSFPLLAAGLVAAGPQRRRLSPQRAVAAVARGGPGRARAGHRHPRRRRQLRRGPGPGLGRPVRQHASAGAAGFAAAAVLSLRLRGAGRWRLPASDASGHAPIPGPTARPPPGLAGHPARARAHPARLLRSNRPLLLLLFSLVAGGLRLPGLPHLPAAAPGGRRRDGAAGPRT